VHWSPGTGAHITRGAVHGGWAARGWENGPLGYPITEEYGVAGGVAQGFQGGVLTAVNGRVR
jgi:uncharacterized protein with LGFP repeats